MSKKVSIVFIGVGLAAVMISAAMFAASDVNMSYFDRPAAVESAPQFVTTVIPNRDHVRGAADPQVYWIEYADLECPYCISFHPMLEQMIAEYADDVQWVYRHFPLVQYHDGAFEKAVAAECVGELAGEEVFWQFVSLVYRRTDATGLGLEVSELPSVAEELGVNGAQLQSCLESGRYDERVTDDVMTGAASGVQGTPTSFIIGPDGTAQSISGTVSIEQMREILDSIIVQ